MYDFDDFVKCVENCGVAVLMKPNDFFDYMNEKGSGKNINCPLLRKLCHSIQKMFLQNILEK